MVTLLACGLECEQICSIFDTGATKPFVQSIRQCTHGILVSLLPETFVGQIEIELVIASFAMHSDGKLPDVQVEKAEKWLRVRSKSDERAGVARQGSPD